MGVKKEYLITKGKYDVTQSLAVDEKSKLLYFIASPNNATQRYLYKVRLDGKGKLDEVVAFIVATKMLPKNAFS